MTLNRFATAAAFALTIAFIATPVPAGAQVKAGDQGDRQCERSDCCKAIECHFRCPPETFWKLLVTFLMPESRKGLSESANMSSEWTRDERRCGEGTQEEQTLLSRGRSDMSVCAIQRAASRISFRHAQFCFQCSSDSY